MAHQNDFFSRFARNAAKRAGQPAIFGSAVLIILVWALAGPIFKFSDTWQLVINTSTTIITFLMVFLIQNTQNRDSEAMHLKLDELIRASSAHNALLDIEELSEKELDAIKIEYEELAKAARPMLQGGTETEAPKIKKQTAPGLLVTKRKTPQKASPTARAKASSR